MIGIIGELLAELILGPIIEFLFQLLWMILYEVIVRRALMPAAEWVHRRRPIAWVTYVALGGVSGLLSARWVPTSLSDDGRLEYGAGIAVAIGLGVFFEQLAHRRAVAGRSRVATDTFAFGFLLAAAFATARLAAGM